MKRQDGCRENPSQDQGRAARLPPVPADETRFVPAVSSWKLWRRCPDCEWDGASVHGETEINDYDEQLDFGTRELACELKMLERANMKQATEIFVAALAADLIGPDDFV